MTDFAARRTIMVDTQVRPSDVTKFPIIDAMLMVPREAFVPRDKREAAYVDGNIELGSGRVMLEPRSLAKMLDALDLQNSDLVLDVAAGLGYSSAVMARIAQAVVALESNETMADDAQTALLENDALNVAVHCGDLAAGAPEHGPYDAMIVQGGIETLPDALADQLKEGGRVAAIFMDGALGEARIGYKIDGVMNWRLAFNASAPRLPGFAKDHAFSL